MSAQAEEFYTDFWKQDAWSGPCANLDEQVRWSGIQSLLKMLPDAGTENALDLGCGRGWLTKLLAQSRRTIGADPVHGAISTARTLFPDLQFVVGGVGEATETSGCQFNLVVCSEVIEHVPFSEKAKFLDSIKSGIATDGYLILTTPRGEWYNHARDAGFLSQPVEDWLTEKELHSLLASQGFQILQTTRRYVPGYDFNVVLRTLARRPFRWGRRLPILMRFLAALQNRYGIYQFTLSQRVDA